MTRRLFIIQLAAILLCGVSCADKIEKYLDDPKTLLEDPVSVNHQQALDDLERSYLRKEMTYAEYLQQKKQIEDAYTLQVEKRQQIIENQ